jgi:hypothetical protein
MLIGWQPDSSHISPGWQPNLHLVGRQLDANFIRLVASRMQTIDKFGYFVLHGC